MNAFEDFVKWWDDLGSGITPLPGHDMEEHARRVASIAFETGLVLGRSKDLTDDRA